MGRLTEDNIKETLREVRMALLEADVALPVVKAFVGQVKERAVGTEVTKSLKPGQVFIKIVQSELESVMGEANEKLNLATQPPAVVLMAGLQVAGKTTSVGKLAKYLTEREKKKVMVVSADVYRPAAIKQLETLAGEVNVAFHPSTILQKPIDIVNDAIVEAKKNFFDVLLVDTAGRLHVDNDMMHEVVLHCRFVTSRVNLSSLSVWAKRLMHLSLSTLSVLRLVSWAWATYLALSKRLSVKSISRKRKSWPRRYRKEKASTCKTLKISLSK